MVKYGLSAAVIPPTPMVFRYQRSNNLSSCQQMLRRDAYDSVIYLHPFTLSTPRKISYPPKRTPTPKTFTVSTLTHTLEAKRTPHPFTLSTPRKNQLPTKKDPPPQRPSQLVPSLTLWKQKGTPHPLGTNWAYVPTVSTLTPPP